MKRLILAFFLIIYAQKAFCFDVEWNKVDFVFPKINNKNLNEFICSIWKQDEYYAPEELDVYNIYCSLSDINVFLYREPIGTSHSVGYYILQDTSGYHDLSLIEILGHILNVKRNKYIDSKLIFLKDLLAVADFSSLIGINSNESSYFYSRHGMSSLSSMEIAHNKSPRLYESHYSIIDQWIVYNYGIRCEYNLKNLYSSRGNEVKLIKASFETKDGFCLYLKINSDIYFYKIEKGFTDTILLNLADKVINHSRMSNSQKILLIRRSLDTLINLYHSVPEL